MTPRWIGYCFEVPRRLKLISGGIMGIIIAILLSSYASSADLQFPKETERRTMLTRLASEMERLDGDGLIPRTNRTETWPQTVAALEQEVAEAGSLFEMGRVFRRLDAAYPNLHAHTELHPQLDERASAGKVSLPFHFAPERLGENYSGGRFFAAGATGAEIQNGDEILEINGLSMADWENENFNFCNFPLRSQCAAELDENFQNELLNWDRHRPLRLKLRRGKSEMSVAVNPVLVPLPKRQMPTAENCGVAQDRYEGFSSVHLGTHLCAFEKGDTVVLRIRSFYYDDPKRFNINDEVNAFWNAYWRAHAGQTRVLILDVIGNFGGDSPTPYYDIFLDQPYQEEYVRFKKIAEIGRADILQSLFWGDPGKDIWWRNIHHDGTFAAVSEGGFLPPVPQFCANENLDCREGKFAPRPNGFRGEVRVLTDSWCISSCVGFLYGLRTFLGPRMSIYGMPDSGDSAFSRLSIFSSPGHSSVEALDAKGEPWVKQIVSVTQSTGPDGRILSGRPQAVDHWVERTWGQSDDDWAKSVFQSADPRLSAMF